MQDEQIVGMLLERKEEALEKTRDKYGRYIKKIAYNILGDAGECEECLNDVLLKAWKSVPPEKPGDLRAYLVMLTRRNAVSMLRKRTAGKRKKAQYDLSLDELEETLSDFKTPESEAELKLLVFGIESYLKTLPEEQRRAFTLRYYYCEPVKSVAKAIGAGESKTKTMLYRIRLGLKSYLEKECII